jgi:hypothetical protein
MTSTASRARMANPMIAGKLIVAENWLEGLGRK